MKTVKDIDVRNKRVLVRVDYNVPLDKDLNITDDTRIVESLPTVKYLIENGAKVILMSHLGRPKGKDPKLSLAPVARRLSVLLGKDVKFVDDCIGDNVKWVANSLKSGEVMVLENLRFHPEEEKNDEGFAKELASLADIFVQDAFGTVHRAHASTSSVAKLLSSVAGFLLEKELKFLNRLLTSPERPYVAILGGAKVSDKIKVIENLSEKVDSIIIGGAMAYTFLKSQNIRIGKSLVEDDQIQYVSDLYKKMVSRGVNIFLPVDHIVATEISKDAESKYIPSVDIPADWMGVDIGENTVSRVSSVILNSKTILWNGPLGVFEIPSFSGGTRRVASLIAEATSKGATSVVGGGDTVAAIKVFGFESKQFSHVSTGGGASLELLEGKELPGVAVLQ